MGRRRRQPFPKQKLRLYADHNFPAEVVEAIRSISGLRRKVSINTAAEVGNERRDDQFQFEYCRKNGLVLLTLDDDFMDDRRFPFGEGRPGIIKVVDGPPTDVLINLARLLEFLAYMPLPNNFAGDSKFQVSSEGTVMRGRDSETRRVKTLEIRPGMTTEEVARHFSYLQEPE